MGRLAFSDKVLACAERNRSLLCVGLDPDPARMPQGFEARPRDLVRFNRSIIEATQDLVCAFKPNIAFYEAFGPKGIKALRRTIDLIPDEIPVIIDAKRGDIGHTAQAYARGIFDALGGDAVTVNPLLGSDSVRPFLDFTEKGVFVLCLTSNPGADDFQIRNNLPMQIAAKCRAWAEINPNVGLVVGATRPEQLREIRAMCPSQWILVPGVGAQGGDLAATVHAGVSHLGLNLIISASRSVIHASRGVDFAEAARREAERLREEIHACLTSPPSSASSIPTSAKP